MLGFFAHKKIGLPEHETPVGRFLPADVFCGESLIFGQMKGKELLEMKEMLDFLQT